MIKGFSRTLGTFRMHELFVVLIAIALYDSKIKPSALTYSYNSATRWISKQTRAVLGMRPGMR